MEVKRPHHLRSATTRVSIITPVGNRVDLTMDSNATVLSLKNSYAAKTGSAPKQLSRPGSGRLEDHRRLFEYNIEDGTVLHETHFEFQDDFTYTGKESRVGASATSNKYRKNLNAAITEKNVLAGQLEGVAARGVSCSPKPAPSRTGISSPPPHTAPHSTPAMSPTVSVPCVPPSTGPADSFARMQSHHPSTSSSLSVTPEKSSNRYQSLSPNGITSASSSSQVAESLVQSPEGTGFENTEAMAGSASNGHGQHDRDMTATRPATVAQTREIHDLAKAYISLTKDGDDIAPPPLDIPLDVQVKLHDIVESNDIASLIEWRRKYGALLWFCRIEGELPSAFPSKGTVCHWCVWYRHWTMLGCILATGIGGELEVQGRHCWMNGRTVREFARLLDSWVSSRLRSTGFDYDNSVQAVENMASSKMLRLALWEEFHDWTVCDRLSRKETRMRLYEAVKENQLDALRNAHGAFGKELGLVMLASNGESEGDTIALSGTLTHWAVYYRHWDVLLWLVDSGCVQHVVGTGSIFLGKTPLQLSEFLDIESGNQFFLHEFTFLRIAGPHRDMWHCDRMLAGPGPAAGRCILSDCKQPASYSLRPCNHICLCHDHGVDAGETIENCPMCKRRCVQVPVRMFMA